VTDPQFQGDDIDAVLRMIRHASVAAALRELAGTEPDAARGLNKAAALHSARVGLIANEVGVSPVERSNETPSRCHRGRDNSDRRE
jgi:hypothetical protein